MGKLLVQRRLNRPRRPLNLLKRFVQAFNIHELPLSEQDAAILQMIWVEVEGLQFSTAQGYLSQLNAFYMDASLQVAGSRSPKDGKVYQPLVAACRKGHKNSLGYVRKRCSKLNLNAPLCNKIIQLWRPFKTPDQVSFALLVSMLYCGVMRISDSAPRGTRELLTRPNKQIRICDFSFLMYTERRCFPVKDRRRANVLIVDKEDRKNNRHGLGIGFPCPDTESWIKPCRYANMLLDFRTNARSDSLAFVWSSDGSIITEDAIRKVVKGALLSKLGYSLSECKYLSWRRGARQDGEEAGRTSEEACKLGDWAYGKNQSEKLYRTASYAQLTRWIREQVAHALKTEKIRREFEKEVEYLFEDSSDEDDDMPIVSPADPS